MNLIEIQKIFGLIAVIFAGVSHILYIASILKKETRPSRVTWFIWAILGGIIAFSYRSSGATTTLLVPLGEALWYTIIALLSIKYGVGGWTKIDKIALAGAGLSGFVWYITGSAVIALLAGIGVDMMAAIPTIYKSYKDPYSEDKKAWVFTSAGSLLNMFAINQISLPIIAYPLYMFVANTLITCLLFRKNI